MTDGEVQTIVCDIIAKFPCYGQGTYNEQDPGFVARTLADRPAVFALGVPIETVVRHTLAMFEAFRSL